MGKGMKIRRAAGLTAALLAVLAISGTGATAAALPPVLNGSADSQALHVRLTIPTSDELNHALEGMGLPAALPGGLEGVTIDQVLSLNHGESQRLVSKSVSYASGFAAPLQGTLQNLNVDTRCEAGQDCSGADNDKAIADETITAPLGLGEMKVGGATSKTTTTLDTINTTAFMDVNLSLKDIIGPGGPLEDIGALITDLTGTLNDEVLPPVNDTLGDLIDTLDALPPEAQPIVDQIKTFLSVGQIDPLPSLAEVDLLELTILGARASVKSKSVNGATGLLASSISEVGNVNILGGWATLEAVGIEATAYANGVKKDTNGEATVQIAGANLGGLLGLDLTGNHVADLADLENLKNELRANAPAGLEDEVEDIIATLDILTHVAGLDVEFFAKTERVGDDAEFAEARSGTLKITAAPALPNPEAVQRSLELNGEGTVPRLSENDYVATGIVLEVELPSAAAYSAVASNVSAFRPSAPTGVPTPLLAGVLLIGAAAIVRRFALSR